MLKRSLWVAALVGATLMPGYAQSKSNQDFVLQVTGNFTKVTSTQAGSHTAEQSPGLLLTYSRALSSHHGVQANYGVLRNRQEFKSTFLTGAGIFGGYSRVNLHEFSAAYVYHANPGKKFNPFALVGAGALVFDQVLAGATTPTKLEMIYGGGVDIETSSKVFFRVMYRGQVYRIPGLGHLFGSNVQGFSHVMQPTVGAGFRF